MCHLLHLIGSNPTVGRALSAAQREYRGLKLQLERLTHLYGQLGGSGGVILCHTNMGQLTPKRQGYWLDDTASPTAEISGGSRR